MKILMPICARHGTRSILVLLCSIMIVGRVAADTPTAKDPLMPPDTASPRATLTSFITALEEMYQIAGEPGRQRETLEPLNLAIRCLDLSEVPPYLVHTKGPETAMMLKEVLDRIELPALEGIPDLVAVEQSRSGEKADSVSIERWLIPKTSIAVAQITEGPRSGEFLFTAETVKRTPEFYSRVRHLPYQASATPDIYEAYILTPGRGLQLGWGERLPEWTKHIVGGQSLWQWIATAGVLIVGAVLVALLITGGRRWDAHLYKRRKTRRDARQQAAPEKLFPEVVKTQRGTLVSLVVSVVLIYAADWFIADGINVGAQFLAAVRLLLIITGVGLVSWGAPLLLIEGAEIYIRFLKVDTKDTRSQLIRLGARTLSLIIVPVVLVTAANLIGLPAYSVVAGLGIGGLAVALAAQGPIQDMIGALTLLSRPLRVGDSCSFNDKIGTVEQIGLRSTQVRTPERSLLMIPNAELSTTQIDVVGRRDRILWRSTVNLSLKTTPEQIENVLNRLRQVVDDHEKVVDDPSLVRLTSAGPKSLDVEIYAYIMTTDWNEFLEIREDLLLLILREIDAAGTTLIESD